MKLAWDSSYADSAAMKRRERAGFVWQLPDGTVQVNVYQSSSDTPCSSANLPTPPFPGVPIAEFHTHPFRHGDITPSNCPDHQPGLTYSYDAKKYGGPSRSDFSRLSGDTAYFRTYGAPPFNGYVLDKDNIYEFPPTTTTSNWKTKVVKYIRNDKAHSCVRP